MFSGGYHANHPVILRLWKVLDELTLDQQREFLMFVTSCSRPPLLGFEHLEPRLKIHMSNPDVGNPDDYLPTASTCKFLKK